MGESSQQSHRAGIRRHGPPTRPTQGLEVLPATFGPESQRPNCPPSPPDTEIAKKNHALNSVDVFVSGIGLGRDAAIRAVSTVGIKLDSITDVTPIAHGGVRPKGERKP